MKRDWHVLADPDAGDYTEMIHGDDPEGYPDPTTIPAQKERVHAQNWDLLVVLDACRWDALAAALAATDVEAEAVSSPAASTPYWLEKVWTDFEDTTPGDKALTYVSGSPRTDPESTLGDDQERVPDLRERVDLRQCSGSREHAVLGCWDREMGTARPGTLTKRATAEAAPKLVHYMQPHTPFMGDLKLAASGRVGNAGYFPPERSRVYAAVEAGLIDVELVRLAYFLNLIWVLGHVDDLLHREQRRGDVETAVITADHGEVLEPDRCSHGSLHDAQTTVVPWVEVEL